MADSNGRGNVEIVQRTEAGEGSGDNGRLSHFGRNAFPTVRQLCLCVKVASKIKSAPINSAAKIWRRSLAGKQNPNSWSVDALGEKNSFVRVNNGFGALLE